MYEAGLKTSMTDEKLQHLSDMGFEWSVLKERFEAVWNQRFDELREFQDKHGHCRVPQRSSGKLGLWVMTMRSIAGRPKCNVKTGKLTAVGLFDY